MASVSGIGGFYRQKKKGAATKPSPAAAKGRSTAGSGGATFFSACDAIHSPDLQEHGEAEAEKLRAFDLDMRFGPCLGLSRMERWDRAAAMGLHPPADVEAILSKSSASALECLWEGRV